jgi:hypothetical protein
MWRAQGDPNWGDEGWYKRPAASGGSFALTFNQLATLSGGAGPSYDFGTMSYTPGNTRVIFGIATLSGSATTSIVGVTIGGVALAHVPNTFAFSGSTAFGLTDIWESTGPLSGSSGDVVVTVSDSINPFGETGDVALYSLITSSPTVSSANNAESINSATLSAALTVPAGGVGIALSCVDNGSAQTISLTATDQVGSRGNIFAHTTSTGSISPTATFAASGASALSVAAWGP